jgi:hypothetical protein
MVFEQRVVHHFKATTMILEIGSHWHCHQRTGKTFSLPGDALGGAAWAIHMAGG